MVNHGTKVNFTLYYNGELIFSKQFIMLGSTIKKIYKLWSAYSRAAKSSKDFFQVWVEVIEKWNGSDKG